MSSDWRDGAACNGMDTDLWFPVFDTPRTREQARQVRIAKQTCEGCPVRLECLEYAISTGQRHGIWGGMSERSRRGRPGAKLRRQLAAMPA